MYITLDALRLRNVIELFGILGTSCMQDCFILVTSFTAFHLGMLVTAALQVHETRTALVQQTGCDATVNAIVSFSTHSQSNSEAWLDLRRRRYSLEQSSTIPDRVPLYNCGFLGNNVLLRKRALRGIWVCLICRLLAIINLLKLGYIPCRWS